MSTCGMTILNKSEFDVDPSLLAPLPPLPRDDGGPVFAEPWQAQAFAMAVRLSEEGHFTWKEWAAALANELKVATSRREPDDGSRCGSRAPGHGQGLGRSGFATRAKGGLGRSVRAHPHGKPVEVVAASG